MKVIIQFFNPETQKNEKKTFDSKRKMLAWVEENEIYNYEVNYFIYA
ncbi:hypothetical protein [Aeribacillus pallidus]